LGSPAMCSPISHSIFARRKFAPRGSGSMNGLLVAVGDEPANVGLRRSAARGVSARPGTIAEGSAAAQRTLPRRGAAGQLLLVVAQSTAAPAAGLP
jgi:hypothetical protein